MPKLQWRPSEPTAAEMSFLERESAAEDPFDRLKLKAGVWRLWKEGGAKMVCKELDGGLARVITLIPEGEPEPAWDLWGRVFQWMGPSSTGGAWKIFLLAAGKDRAFPATGQDLGPEHVNGGYTRPCSTEGIIIYRSEEATRVLVHELLHAGCLDEMGWSVPLREAAVETWAELFLVALVSKGVTTAAADVWAKQAQWVVDTNWKAAALHGTHDISDYAWRYLKGREEMYERLGVELPAVRQSMAAGLTSLRFTHPLLGD